jgi:hypothetical protein
MHMHATRAAPPTHRHLRRSAEGSASSVRSAGAVWTLEGQATLPGSIISCCQARSTNKHSALAGAAGEAHASFPVRAADVISGGASDVRAQAQRHAADGLPILWVRVPGGTLLKSTVFPTDESMYGALTRVVQPPRCWQREAGACSFV